jgi:hypothetical protein
MGVLACLIPGTAITSYPPAAGVDVLDAVGAGAGLGAAVGAFDGGAIVGDGFGAGDVVLLAGRELVAVAAAAELDLPADRDARRRDLLADGDGDGDGLPAGVLADDEVPVGLWLADDCVPVVPVVPAALCAAVLENRVVIPKAATALSSVARHVSRDRRRSPLSRLALRFRCLMAVISSGLRLRAHQGRPSGSLSSACRRG